MQDQPQNLRGLKALVGIMAVLIIIGTTVVVGTLIHRFYAKTTPTPTTTTLLHETNAADIDTDLPSPTTLALPQGLQIEGIAAIDHNLAVWVRGPVGDKIIILNPKTGQAHTAVTSH